MTTHYQWTYAPEDRLKTPPDDQLGGSTDDSNSDEDNSVAAEIDAIPEPDTARTYGPGRGYGETPRQPTPEDATPRSSPCQGATGIELLKKAIRTAQPVGQGLERSNSDSRLFEKLSNSTGGSKLEDVPPNETESV